MRSEDFENKGSLSDRRPTAHTSPFVSGYQPQVSLRDNSNVANKELRVIPSKPDASGGRSVELSKLRQLALLSMKNLLER